MQSDRDIDVIRERQDARAVDAPFVFVADDADQYDALLDEDWHVPTVSERLSKAIEAAQQTSADILEMQRAKSA